MSNKIFFFILAISILSLIIVFPRFHEKEETKINWQNVNNAKNLCIALCEYIKNNFTVEGVCLSDKDTITGIYWTYPKISCFVNNDTNPCIEKGDIEIILDDNCMLKDIKYIENK